MYGVLRAQCRFQLKKVLGIGVAVGHVGMTPNELMQNISLAVNF